MNRLSALTILVLACGACVPSQAEPLDSTSTSAADESEPDPEPEPEPEPDPEPGETEEGSEEMGGLTFVPDEDFGGTGCECDPFAQDCPEGEKCVPYSSVDDGVFNANKCVAVTDNQGPGDPCIYDGHVLASDNCDENSICFDLIPTDFDKWKGTCRAFCDGTADDPDCGEGESCLIEWDGSTNLCLPSCDPLAQDCAEGSACHYANSTDFVCTIPSAPGAAGDPCVYLNDCGAGLVCLDSAVVDGCEDGSCCTSYCEVGLEPDPCADQPNHSCEPFFDEPFPGVESLGVCIDVDGLP